MCRFWTRASKKERESVAAALDIFKIVYCTHIDARKQKDVENMDLDAFDIIVEGLALLAFMAADERSLATNGATTPPMNIDTSSEIWRCPDEGCNSKCDGEERARKHGGEVQAHQHLARCVTGCTVGRRASKASGTLEWKRWVKEDCPLRSGWLA